MSKNVFITGATGKVGSELVAALEGSRLSVRAAVHSVGNASSLRKSGVEYIPFDFDATDSIASALKDIDTLVLITPPDSRQVDWAIRTIDQAKAAGVKHVVRMSVLAAAMEPGITLGRWHRTVEAYLKNSGLEYTIVRPSPFMQNFLGMYPSSSDGFALPVGDAPVNHIHVADVAAALAAVVTGSGHTSHTYMITGAQPLSFSQSAAMLSRHFRSITQDQARNQFAQGRPEWFVEILLELFAAFDSGAVGLRTSTYEDLTGRSPRLFSDFAKDFGKAAA